MPPAVATAALLLLGAYAAAPGGRPPAFSAVVSPDPIAVLREAVAPAGAGERPSPDSVLRALAQAGRRRPPLAEREQVFRRYAAPGKEWRLVYVASKDQATAARAGAESLPGVYVPDIVNYRQRFEGDGAVRVKKEGIQGDLFGNPFFLGDVARIKWPCPAKRTTMVIESVATKLEAFGQEWLFPAEGVISGEDGNKKFEKAPVRKKYSGGDFTCVNFVYADDDVAIAQAETGALGLYGAVDNA